MSDIVERLRAWVYTDSQYATAREAADEIERLRAIADRRGELAVDRRREIQRLNKLRDDDGEVMSKLIDGYQRILRLLIDGPESMATDIVSDAREWLDGYAGRVSTHSAKCHGWHDACLIARLVSECERLSEQKNLTRDERAALSFAADAYALNDDDHDCWRIANTLRGLLSRTGTNSRQTSDDATECHSQSGKTPERDRRND